MDIVFIRQLQVDAVIGVYDWEKTIRQQLLLDLELTTNTQQAALSDDLRKTLDYAVIAQQVTELIQAEPVGLIETVAERVAQLLLAGFATTHVKVTVSKPAAVPTAQTVGVSIVRSR